MTLLYERRCRVLVTSPLSGPFASVAVSGGQGLAATQTEVIGLRTVFHVEKRDGKEPNTANVEITNLSEHTRAAWQAKGSRVILQAGYKDTIATIFVGDVRTIDHIRAGADWTTKIELGDGERSYLHARVSKSFAAGTAMVDVAKAIMQPMGLDADAAGRKLAVGLAGRQFVNGYATHGTAQDELNRLLKAVRYTWSIQDGRIQVLARGETNTESIVTLGSDSGLIGSPEYGTADKKGSPPVLKFKALLSPDIRPGGRVEFSSLRHKGVHRVLSVTHSGDTAGGDWETSGEAQVL